MELGKDGEQVLTDALTAASTRRLGQRKFTTYLKRTGRHHSVIANHREILTFDGPRFTSGPWYVKHTALWRRNIYHDRMPVKDARETRE